MAVTAAAAILVKELAVEELADGPAPLGPSGSSTDKDCSGELGRLSSLAWSGCRSAEGEVTISPPELLPPPPQGEGLAWEVNKSTEDQHYCYLYIYLYVFNFKEWRLHPK